ncbi:MAG: hypothetical protein AAGD86_13240, partial [Pseudomonadota bacterium]
MTTAADTTGMALLMPDGCRATDRTADSEEGALQKSAELDRFLEGVERRAFRIALFGVRNPDDALDVVQDAMMQLAR